MTALLVDTASLVAAAARLESVVTPLDDLRDQLSRLEWTPPEMALSSTAPTIFAAALAGAPIVSGCTHYTANLSSIAARLRAAADLYRAAEAAAHALAASLEQLADWGELAVDVTTQFVTQSVGQITAWLLGRATAFALTLGISWTIGFVVAAAVGAGIGHGALWLYAAWTGQRPPSFEATIEALGEHAGQALEAYLEEHGISFADLLRGVIDGAEEFVLGAFGVPLPPALLLALQQGPQSRPTVAAIMAAVHAFQAAHPNAFSVTIRGTTVFDPPRSERPTLGTMVAGIPLVPAADQVATMEKRYDAQVRVTTYEPVGGGGEPIYHIGITGTIEPGFTDDQPLDNRGNLEGYGYGDADSVAAVLQAIEAAGVPDGARVVLSAYSQGSIAAMMIAASGRYDVEFVTTIGCPVRPIELPDDIPVVEIEHRDDPIAALQGTRPPGNDGATVILADAPGANDTTAANPQSSLDVHHSQAGYQQTADALDASSDPAVAAAQAKLDAIFDGYEATQQQDLHMTRNGQPGWNDPLAPLAPGHDGVPVPSPDAAEQLATGAQEATQTAVDTVTDAVEALGDAAGAAAEQALASQPEGSIWQEALESAGGGRR